MRRNEASGYLGRLEFRPGLNRLLSGPRQDDLASRLVTLPLPWRNWIRGRRHLRLLQVGIT